MVKIECEVHELHDLLNQEQVRRSAELQQQVYDLQDKLVTARDENDRLRASPIRQPSEYEQQENIKLLIRALTRPDMSGKIPAIKAVRTLLGLGLKEAKDLVDGNWGQPTNW